MKIVLNYSYKKSAKWEDNNKRQTDADPPTTASSLLFLIAITQQSPALLWATAFFLFFTLFAWSVLLRLSFVSWSRFAFISASASFLLSFWQVEWIMCTDISRKALGRRMFIARELSKLSILSHDREISLRQLQKGRNWTRREYSEKRRIECRWWHAVGLFWSLWRRECS